VIAVTDADDPGSYERLLDVLAGAFANTATNNAALGGGAAAAVLNPEHAQALAAAGHDRKSITEGIRDRAKRRSDESSILGDRGPHCFQDAADLLLWVAGGPGLYSAVMPTWCGGAHQNRGITKPVVIGQACEIPGVA